MIVFDTFAFNVNVKYQSIGRARVRLPILVSILIMTIAELSFQFNHPYLCLILHILNVLFVICLATFKKIDLPVMFLPVSTFRIVNLSMPILFPLTIYWIPLVYVSILPAIFYAVRVLDLTPERLGFTMRFWYLMPVTFVIGAFLGYLEFRFSKTTSLIPSLSFIDISVLCLVMFVFVGFIEELMFRSVIQTKLEDTFGRLTGLLVASAVFGIMHVGSFILMFISGIVIGFIFQKTKNITLATVIHGTACVFAYGLLPMGIRLPTFSVGLS